jgi:hypothetical protein
VVERKILTPARNQTPDHPALSAALCPSIFLFHGWDFNTWVQQRLNLILWLNSSNYLQFMHKNVIKNFEFLNLIFW